MLLAAIVLILGLFWLETFYRLLLFVAFWAFPLWLAGAVSHYVITLRLSDPLASLWAFLAAAVIGRVVMGRVRDYFFWRG